jgi:hypothetical protein
MDEFTVLVNNEQPNTVTRTHTVTAYVANMESCLNVNYFRIILGTTVAVRGGSSDTPSVHFLLHTPPVSHLFYSFFLPKFPVLVPISFSRVTPSTHF